MSLTISAAALAGMRAQVSEMLPDTCVVHSPNAAAEADGWTDDTYAAAGTYSCRVDPIPSRNATETDIAMREDTDRMYQLTLPFDTTIAENYRVVHDSITFEIVQMSNTHSNNVSIRATLKEYQA